jgi:hypothetical protein
MQNGRVSPRTSSHHSVKSTHSDKGSKASASSLSEYAGDYHHHQPNIALVVVPTATAAEKRTSAQEAGLASHAAKVARMEAPAGAMGMSGGIPAKIDEEPSFG